MMSVKGKGRNNSHSGGFLLLRTEDWAKATEVNAEIRVSIPNILKDEEILNEWTGYNLSEEESDGQQRRVWTYVRGKTYTNTNCGQTLILASWREIIILLSLFNYLSSA